MTELYILRSAVLLLVGLPLLVWGERRWRQVDRAKLALRTGSFARWMAEGGTVEWH